MKTVSITTFKSFLSELKTAAEEQSWTTVRDVTSNSLRELILKSPNDAICSFKEISDNSTYFNIVLNFANSFDNSKSFFDQEGSVYNYPDNSQSTNNVAPVLNLHNNSMNCFFFINVNRIVVVVNALSRYVSAYIGRYLRYGTENQLPNNLFVGGSNAATRLTEPLNSSNLNNFVFYRPNGQYSCSVVKNEVSENTKVLNNFSSVFPFSPFEENSNINIKDQTGNHILTPAVLFSSSASLGELEGIFALSSTNGLTTENVITVNEVNYKVFININKTTRATDFFAVQI